MTCYINQKYVILISKLFQGVKNMRLLTLSVFCASAAMVLSGCYNYEKPAAATMETEFQQRKKDGADELLKDVKLLTIENAQRIALANNPDYRSAYHAVKAAEMVYYQALGSFAPTVNATFSIGQSHSYPHSGTSPHYHDSAFTTNTGINANWVLFSGLSRYFAAKIAKAGQNFQEAMEEDACRTLLRGVAYAYNEIMLAKENIRIADKDMSFQQDCLRETELKYEVGTVPLSEVLNFKIRVNNAISNKITAERTYEIATYVLAVLMGYPEGKFPEWVNFAEIKTDLDAIVPKVEVYLDAALANRPDLRGMREQLKIAEYTKYKSYSAYSPVISAYANFNYQHRDGRSSLNRAHTRAYGPSFEYGASASWTLFNGFIRYNQVREAQANMAIAEFALASAWLGVIQEVRTAYTNYIQSVRQAKIFEGTLKYSTEQRDLVAKEYEAGTIGITRLNEVQKDLVDAEATLASAYINTKNAMVQLEAAAGMISANYKKLTGDENAKTQASDIENAEVIKSGEKAMPSLPANPKPGN